MTEAGALDVVVTQHIVTAMKGGDKVRLGTLRLIKNALKNKAIEKREALTTAEEQQTLGTMIKQRRDSMEQFAQGGRPELVAIEAEEIKVIEEFLPKELGEDGLRELVKTALADVEAAIGHKPGPRDMGPSMKAVQAKVQATGARADGRMVSEMVKKELGLGT
jgi:uncharacterized protein YqeY